MQYEAKNIIEEYSEIMGWNNNSKIDILSDFINHRELCVEFAEYVKDQMQQELGFPWTLESGDEFIWNDPAGEPQTHVINSISYGDNLGDDDCVISITTKSGSTIECFAHEVE